jgi:hypothetical protein
MLTRSRLLTLITSLATTVSFAAPVSAQGLDELPRPTASAVVIDTAPVIDGWSSSIPNRSLTIKYSYLFDLLN